MKMLSTAIASDFMAKVGKREKVEVEGLAYQFLSLAGFKERVQIILNSCAKNFLPGSKNLEPVDRSKEEDENMVEVIEDSPHPQTLVGKKRNSCDSPGTWGLNNSDAGKLSNQGMVCPSAA